MSLKKLCGALDKKIDSITKNCPITIKNFIFKANRKVNFSKYEPPSVDERQSLHKLFLRNPEKVATQRHGSGDLEASSSRCCLSIERLDSSWYERNTQNLSTEHSEEEELQKSRV